MYYQINEGTARAAHDMMSFSDYQPGSATAEYRAAVDKAAALVERCKASTSPYYHGKLDALLDRYARHLADWTNAYNRNGASCPSVMISGASNFPVRKKLRQNAREESLWAEYKEIEGILEKIKSVGTGPVDLTDPHAREILTGDLEAAQKTLEYCKAGNAYFRKHKTLRGYGGLTDEQADSMTDPEEFGFRLYGKPYPDYELASLRGRIKRVQARLEELDKLQQMQAQPTADEQHDGFKVVRNAEQNRLQLIFDGKPDEQTRQLLKSNGFRWSPRNQAWQRQLTNNAEYALRSVIESITT